MDIVIAIPLARSAAVIYGRPVAYVWMQVMALLRWRGLWLVPGAGAAAGIDGHCRRPAAIGLSKGQNLIRCW